MKKFFQFLLSVFAAVTAALGALVIFDRIVNKNRIKGEYLPCDNPTECNEQT